DGHLGEAGGHLVDRHKPDPGFANLAHHGLDDRLCAGRVSLQDVVRLDQKDVLELLPARLPQPVVVGPEEQGFDQEVLLVRVQPVQLRRSRGGSASGAGRLS
ncbi:MAG: hypothetical protein AB1486_13795, partial [Planctomycetota bacterium]